MGRVQRNEQQPEKNRKTAKPKRTQAKAARKEYRGQADASIQASDDDSDVEEVYPEKKKRVGVPSSVPARFKDAAARQKEESLLKSFFDFAAMMRLEGDDVIGSDSDDYDDSVDGQRIVPVLFVQDPFKNHNKVGGAPRKDDSIELKKKPHIVFACSCDEAKNTFISTMNDVVQAGWKSTDEFDIDFVHDREEAIAKRNQNEDRKRLLSGSSAAAAQVH